MKNIFSALVLGLALAGCAQPVYRYHYEMTPPADTAGQACAANCLTSLQACVAACHRGQAACTSLDEQEWQRLNTAEPYPGSDVKCPVAGCETRCTEANRSCFTGCGGTVVKQKVCVENCR
jgi:hypothetical protein